MLKEHLDAFDWGYKEMKGVHPSVCTYTFISKKVANQSDNPSGE